MLITCFRTLPPSQQTQLSKLHSYSKSRSWSQTSYCSQFAERLHSQRSPAADLGRQRQLSSLSPCLGWSWISFESDTPTSVSGMTCCEFILTHRKSSLVLSCAVSGCVLSSAKRPSISVIYLFIIGLLTDIYEQKMTVKSIHIHRWDT